MKSIQEIMNMISLQEEVVTMVNETLKRFNVDEYKEYSLKLLDISTAADARGKLVESLSDDLSNIKMLTVMFDALRYTYEKYQEKGMSDDIFISTMKAFTRFLQEHYDGNKVYKFDRDWWIYRQIAMTIFRIGELEYEMKVTDNNRYISLHIPSDANLDFSKVNESINEAKKFFNKYYPEFNSVLYRCSSWLLSSDLKKLLNENSNILKFQSLFNITKEDYGTLGFIKWIYKKEYSDYTLLPEDTSLQRNLKKYLLEGNLVSVATGFLKDSGEK